MKRLILLIQFLTRIPINIKLNVTREDLSKAVIYFPIIGYIIGGILVLTQYGLNNYIDKIILAFLILTIEVIITGGLHLDGLSDTFDGIYSGRKKERILDIMKDPNVGTFGVLSLMILIIAKFLLIYKIDNNLLLGLLAMPVFSRFCVVYASRFGNYAKETGLGDLFIGQVNNIKLLISFIFIMPIFIFKIEFIVIFFINVIFTAFFVNYISKKIGGITGDILGAIVEINEVLFLFSIYLFGRI